MPNPFIERPGSAFRPTGNTPTYATAGASAAFPLPSGDSIRIVNDGTLAFYIAFGTSGISASASNIKILPGTDTVWGVPDNCTHIAVFGTGGEFSMIGGQGV